MNSKNVNRVFLGIIVLHLMVEVLVMVVYLISGRFLGENLIANLLLAQGVIIVPALVCTLATKKTEHSKMDILGFKKIKPITVLAMLGYTLCIMPVSTFLNSISMLWVDNVMVESSEMIIGATFPVAFLAMCVIGPFIEEFTFRGVALGGYREDGYGLGAIILSAILFGLMHMNFNQAPYAIFIGVAFGFVVVATDSIWSSFICHFIFNAESVVTMFLINWLYPGYFNESNNAVTTVNDQIVSIAVYGFISVIAIVLGVLLLRKIAKIEGHTKELELLFVRGERKGKLVTVSLIIAIILALAFMTFQLYLEHA